MWPLSAMQASPAGQRVSKYADHLPLYRQCQIYGRGGVNLDRSTLATWCGVTAYHLAPVVDRMLAHLKRSTRLFMDETRAAALYSGAGPRGGQNQDGLPVGADPR